MLKTFTLHRADYGLNRHSNLFLLYAYYKDIAEIELERYFQNHILS